MGFSDSERKLLLELIGNEQIHMLIKDEKKYDSDKYKNSNMCIIGTSGSGKSYFTKLILLLLTSVSLKIPNLL